MLTLAEVQAAITPWDRLTGASGSAESVEGDLLTLLLVDDDSADDAYASLEETAESQGRLYECAPAVVAVIAAAIAEGVVPAANLAPVLDLLGRIVGGTDVEPGVGGLRAICHQEALRSYWSLADIARTEDPYNAQLAARAVLQVLDGEHSGVIFSS